MRMVLAVGLILSIPSVLEAQDEFGPNPRDVEFASSLRIDLDEMTETDSGLFYRDDVMGTGEPSMLLDTLTLSCTGYLVNGEAFYAGRLTASLGTTRLISGFTEGLVGMRAGGTRTIVIPANLAYGSRGIEGVPPDAVLVYRLRVTEVERARN